ncbi:hypothetical protein ACROYT_G028477 [Oculina patagonica]
MVIELSIMYASSNCVDTTVVQQEADAQSIETSEVTSTTYEIPNSSDYMPLHPSTRSWEIRREQVNIIKNIGKGAFSHVAKVTAKNFHVPQQMLLSRPPHCKLTLRKKFARSEYDFHVWSDDSNKGGEERHIVGVHTWCPEMNKPRAYVLGNSLTASGSGKHQSDVDYHVVHNEYGITNVSGLVGDNASTQKGKANGLIAN